MATFGASFIGDLLKSAHQTGVQDTSIKEIKDISKELQSVVDILSSKEEWVSSDIKLLSETQAHLTKMRDDIIGSADKDTRVLKDIIERLESTITEMQDIIHEVNAKGSFKKDKEDKDEKPKDESDGILKFLHTISPTSSQIMKCIQMSRDIIVSRIDHMWVDLSSKMSMASSKIGILSKDISVSNAISGNMLRDLRNYNVQEQKTKRDKDEKSGLLSDFVKKWGNPENNPIANMTKKMNKFGSFMANFSKNITGLISTIGNVVSLIATNLKRMMITFFFAVLPWVLLIAGIVILAIILIFFIWKYFSNIIKKMWGWILEYGKPVAEFVLGLLWEVAKWIWTALKSVVVFIYDNWSTLGPIIAGLTAAWGTYKIFQAGKWLLQEGWNIAKNLWDKGVWVAQKAWQSGGLIMNFIKGIGPIFAAAFSWILSAGIPFLISILAAIPVIGWIILAIGVIVGFVWFFRKEIWGLIEPIFNWIWNGLKVAWDYYSSIFGQIWDWVKNFWSILWGGLKEAVSGVVKNIGAALNPFNWFASGGEVSKPVKGVVGEAGPEAVIPLSGGGDSKLSKTLIEFFDYYLPFLKPTIDFLWTNFKPYMPILQSILDMIYNVTYSIISGLSNLPGWLGGSIFKAMLSKMSAPKTGSVGTSSNAEKDATFARILEMDNKDITESRLAVIGSNTNGIQSMYSNIKTQAEKVTSLSDIITPSSDNSKLIKQGFVEMSKKIEQAMNAITGTVIANANKTPISDPAYEMSKMLSRGQLGGKI